MKKNLRIVLAYLLVVSILFGQAIQTLAVEDLIGKESIVSAETPMKSQKDSVKESTVKKQVMPVSQSEGSDTQKDIQTDNNVPIILNQATEAEDIQSYSEDRYKSVPENTFGNSPVFFVLPQEEKQLESSQEIESITVADEIYGEENAIDIKQKVLSAGESHSLQVRSDGTVWAWGDNSSGQLGDGTTTTRTTAVQVANLQNVVEVAAGYYHSVALLNDGTVWTWGDKQAKTVYAKQVMGLSDIIAISAGDGFTLALKRDGTVWAWGEVLSDMPVQVEGLCDVKSIEAGHSHSLAIKSDGTVWAWGDNQDGQLGDETNENSNKPVQVKKLSDAKSIAAGNGHSLAIKSDGTVWVWGKVIKRNEPVQVIDFSDVAAIAAGDSHILAIKSDGTVWTWGNNSYGLGEKDYIGTNRPMQLTGLSSVTVIASGYGHSLAIKSNGSVWAWGNNSLGQLGDGTTINRNIPVLSRDITPPSTPSNFCAEVKENGVQLNWEASTDMDGVAGYEIYRNDVKIGVVAETNYSDIFEIDMEGIYIYDIKAYDNAGNMSESARIIINDYEAPTTPLNLKVIATTTTTVSLEWEASTDNLWVEFYEIYRNGKKVGKSSELMFADNSVPCGSTNFYVVRACDFAGNLSEESNEVKVILAGTQESVAISAGRYHSLEVKSDGTVWAWGDNSSGKLGDGTTTTRTTAVQVANLQDVVAVAAGEHHSLALKNDGTVWAWGDNTWNQHGDETYGMKCEPIQVPQLYDVISIAAGRYHNLALKSDGTVWMWAYNKRQLDMVKDLSDVIAIAAGGDHSLALKKDGTVWAWGDNNFGQLGDDKITSSDEPVQVKDLYDIKAIAAGGYHSLALKNDGTLWAWGYNGGGLGDGTTTRSIKPVSVKDLSDVKAIAAGVEQSIALKNDGTVWAWGYNGYGQLGNGTTISSTKSVEVKGLSDVKEIASGSYHNLVLKNDGTVWAWGYNYNGQLGVGTRDNNRITPVLSKDVTPPTAPSNLTAATEEHIVLKWQASEDGDSVAGYEIYRNDVWIDTVNETNYIDTDAQIDKTYIYKVIAFDVSGNKSEAVFVVANDEQQPSKPTNLVVTSKTPTTVSLEWEASTDNMWVEGYEIYRNGEKVGISKSTNYTDAAVPHDSTYVYVVRAYDISGNLSEESNVVTVTTKSLNGVPLAAGESHSLQVKSDGTVLAWGYNLYGQLGDGTTTGKTVSTQVKDLQDIVAVAAGNNHSLALKNDGTVWAWGNNSYGQLGDGTTEYSEIPV